MRRAPQGIYHGEFSNDGMRKERQQRYRATGEYRAPLKGEFFLSGADEHGQPTAYRAPEDFVNSYWIARAVRVIPQPDKWEWAE